MINNLNPHELAQTAYAVGEEFAAMVSSEDRNRYAEKCANGYTGLISLMAEAAEALEVAFQQANAAGRQYTAVFLYEAVPEMVARVATALALNGIDQLTMADLQRMAIEVVELDLEPVQNDDSSDQNDHVATQNEDKPMPEPEVIPGVVYLCELESDVVDAVQQAIRHALATPGLLRSDHCVIDVEGIKATYDCATTALVFHSGIIYGASYKRHEAGVEAGCITSGYTPFIRCYGPPEGWLNADAWAAATRNENGGYGQGRITDKLRNLAAEIDTLLRETGGPEPVSDALGCSASHVTELMTKLADAMAKVGRA